MAFMEKFGSFQQLISRKNVIKRSHAIIVLKAQQEPIQLTVQSWRKHKNFDLLKFVGFESINDVEKFKEGILKVSEDQLQELEEDEYYFHEIIGCVVKDMNDNELGVIKEILTPGANDVWVIKTKENKEYYIPI